jgi:hypothetical protein
MAAVRHERRKTAKLLETGKLAPDFRIAKYLDSPSPWQAQITGSVPGMVLTNRQVICLLMAKNGFNAKVTRWGKFSGPFGLAQPEAFLLMEMTPYLQGLIDGAGLDSVKVIKEHLEPSLMELAAQFEKISADIAAADAAAPAADTSAEAPAQPVAEQAESV